MELLFLLAAAAWLLRARRGRDGRRPAPRRTLAAPGRRRPANGGAGASATAHAQRLRRRARGGHLRQLLTAAGLDTADQRTEAAARRYEAGSVGEQRTAALLQQLGAGFHILHDRALPNSRANIDHLVITPSGRLVLVDSKLWTTRHPVHVRAGRLLHGTRDRTRAVATARWEADQIAMLVDAPVTALIAIHGANVPAAGYALQGVRVIPAGELLAELHATAGPSAPHRAAALARRARAALPPYTERNP